MTTKHNFAAVRLLIFLLGELNAISLQTMMETLDIADKQYNKWALDEYNRLDAEYTKLLHDRAWPK